MAKMGLENKVKQLESSLKAKTEELQNMDKEIQVKIDKQVEYVRKVNNMSKMTLENKIQALEKSLKDK